MLVYFKNLMTASLIWSAFDTLCEQKLLIKEMFVSNIALREMLQSIFKNDHCLSYGNNAEKLQSFLNSAIEFASSYNEAEGRKEVYRFDTAYSV